MTEPTRYIVSTTRSSALGNHLSTLRSAGLLDYPQPGELALTDAGRAHAQAARPLSHAELHQAPKAQAAILRVLLERYPQVLDQEALARQAAQSPRSGACGDHLSTLREASAVLLDRAVPRRCGKCRPIRNGPPPALDLPRPTRAVQRAPARGGYSARKR